jgi:catalase
MTIDVKQMTPRVLAALVSGALASIQPTMIRAEDGTQLVDDFHAAFGKHHARANHAKGVILEILLQRMTQALLAKPLCSPAPPFR